jgi:hypothetical protein
MHLFCFLVILSLLGCDQSLPVMLIALRMSLVNTIFSVQKLDSPKKISRRTLAGN